MINNAEVQARLDSLTNENAQLRQQLLDDTLAARIAGNNAAMASMVQSLEAYCAAIVDEDVAGIRRAIAIIKNGVIP